MHRIFLSLATTSFALVAATAVPRDLQLPFPSAGNCDVSRAKLDLPDNASQFDLTVPVNRTVAAISVGFGVQNYTCNSASNVFASAGAVAEMIDASCVYGTSNFASLQETWFDAWSSTTSTIQEVIETLNGNPFVKGQHFFVPKPSGGSLLAEWDFRASMPNHPKAFVEAAKVGDMPAPTGPSDVDWLKLGRVDGGLATDVFRVQTKAGQPPTSCTPGAAPTSIKYAAIYYFYR